MKRVILFSLITATSLIAGEANATNSNMPQEVKEGIKYIKMLGKELKANVKMRMKKDKSGVEAAEFCANNASKIAKSVSAKFPEGVRVYRTSLKVRNTNHKPDETDIKILNQLQAKFDKKEPVKKPLVVKVGDKVRVYKPLVIEPVCLKCHGNINNINPKIKEIISKKYPDDKAINYKVGDLRGVIVAEMPAKK